MAGSKKLLLSGITAFVLALCLLFGLTLGFGKQSVAYATANEVLDYSNATYQTVNVANDRQLREALVRLRLGVYYRAQRGV